MRPEGWENPYPTKCMGKLFEADVFNDSPEYMVYEEGADAMLRALKKEGISTEAIEKNHLSIPKVLEVPLVKEMHQGTIKGTWVFIPGEE